MVDIISKRDGPRREDVAAKRLLNENRGVIHKMVDHLTGGQLKSQAPRPAAPEEKSLIVHAPRTIESRGAERPYVRVSVNGRVVVADQETSRQLHFLGEIRGPRRSQRFVLATRENGFFALIDDALAETLADLDGRPVDRDFSEDDLALTIAERLGIGEGEAARTAGDQ